MDHNTVDNIIFLGIILSGMFGLLIAGQWQEIRALKRRIPK